MCKEHRELTVEEFQKELKEQGVKRDDLALICPVCNTVQSARWLIIAGAGVHFEEVEKYLGFSCVGRFTGAGEERIEGKGCNWTLGGLFQLNTLSVIDSQGKKHPRFEVATAEQAVTLRDKLIAEHGGED